MRVRRASRAGFSMLETVIALAVLSLAAAIVTTRASAALDQAAVHGAFQDFQAGLLRTRARAFAMDEPREVGAGDVPLGEGWSFAPGAPLRIDGAGVCSGAPVDLVRAGRVRARLTAAGRECRYLRAS